MSSGIRLTNIRNGRAGGAGSSGLDAVTMCGSAARRDVRSTPSATAAPNAVTRHAATMIQGLATSFTALSCHRRYGWGAIRSTLITEAGPDADVQAATVPSAVAVITG